MKIKHLLFIAFFTICTYSVSAQGYKLKTIVIDAGHGGFRPGAAGKYSIEKNVALQVALKLGKEFQKQLPNIKIIQTRTTDVDVDWSRRADIANEAKADLFISIHCNSMPKGNHSTTGVETFVGAYRRINEMDAGIRENEDFASDKAFKKANVDNGGPEEHMLLSLYKSLYRSKSLALAKLIQNNYVDVNKRRDRGVKEQGLLVLQQAAMPSVLTEIGFISTPSEEDYINSPEGQQEIVTAIVNAVKQYKKQVEL